jgi:hypothetical protein
MTEFDVPNDRAAATRRRLVSLVAMVAMAVGAGGAGSSSASSAPDPPVSVSEEQSGEIQTAEQFAGAWADVTEGAIGETAAWTNKVEVADINGDGHVDLLFANGGDYESPGTAVLSRAFLNRGDGSFDDASVSVFGEMGLLSASACRNPSSSSTTCGPLTRVIKARDLDADGNVDIVVGTTYDTQSHLLLGEGDGSFTDATSSNLPAAELSAGDLEVGDVDADGDLDIVIADWGDGSPFGPGGLVNLWLNDGSATFTDATAERMPATLVGFSWDLELVDVDNDWDLDVAVSCKACPTSLLYVNDGSGTFADVSSEQMPAFSNNYEFAPIDLDGDGFLDLVTINDGEQRLGLAEHVFRNDGTGSFVDVTDAWWPANANEGWDDNVVVALDVESDGDADFFVGSLDGPDRLLINDGSGGLSVVDDVFDGTPSRGTLGMAVADLNGDQRLDVVEAQGEVPGHEDERVYLASDAVQPDSAPPVIRWQLVGPSVLARVHDNLTPNMPQDWQEVTARWTGGETPMSWYGENLFRADVPDGVEQLEVCAVDAAGNQDCTS